MFVAGIGPTPRSTSKGTAARRRWRPWLAVAAAIGLLLATLAGCQATTGRISGAVTNALTSKPVAGVTIVTAPAIERLSILTDGNGAYSASLPPGAYTLTFTKANFSPSNRSVAVVAGQTATADVGLAPASPVAVSAGADQKSSPGATVTLEANAEPLDGSTVEAITWNQTAGTPAAIGNPNGATVKATLGTAAAYKAQFLKALMLQDRFVIPGISPYALETAETATFQITVTTSTGNYTASVNVSVTLPYVVSAGIADVPRGLPVLIHGKTQAAYRWSLAAPPGSAAALDSTNDQDPSFTPDMSGKYTVSENVTGQVLNVYAGTWAGVITGQGSDGYPLAAGCTSCHNGTIAPDKFTTWRASGHAKILTENLNTNPGYSPACLVCHTVGFSPAAANGGFDDTSDYQAFLSSGMIGRPSPNNWTNMLALYPRSARLGNDQCENCHGPNDGTTLHPGPLAPERISISSDVCGVCHGEPLRHGRFQQWQQSGHANFDLAIARSTSASCARCHTAQGFFVWMDQGGTDLTRQIQGAKGNATAAELAAMGISPDTAQPQTCAVCHDPHDEGMSSGKPNTATVRIQGDTPLLPSGFQASNVGRGAICITCHNTRNGLHNDGNPPTGYTAPHEASQGDVLMGENAYFVAIDRSPHSYIKDTCATCHMELTLPPPQLSYEGTGTNHTFAASLNVCSNCHSNQLDAASFKQSHQAQVQRLSAALGRYLVANLPAQIVVKDGTPHQLDGKSYSLKSNTTVVGKDNIAAAFPTSSGGQQGFTLQFKEGVSFTYAPPGEPPHTIVLTSALVQLGDITTNGTTPVIPVNSVLVKAGWNYYLISDDSSNGIHNPSWVNNVLNSTNEALFPTRVVPQE